MDYKKLLDFGGDPRLSVEAGKERSKALRDAFSKDLGRREAEAERAMRTRYDSTPKETLDKLSREELQEKYVRLEQRANDLQRFKDQNWFLTYGRGRW